MTQTDDELGSKDVPRPAWFTSLLDESGAFMLEVKEWRDEEWRTTEGGFQGYDFCHSRQASVRILDYILLPGRVGSVEVENAEEAPSHPTRDMSYPMLVGVAHFTPKAESHRGLCHGGSFCALMDDVIGWMGFCVSGEVKPWCGFTVQINTSLKKAVKVGSILRLEAWVERKEGSRKYWIGAKLYDVESGDIHCEGNGLFLSAQKTES